jgi:hypothetical protein
MTALRLKDYRPPYLRKSYPREAYPINGLRGAAHVIGVFGLPVEFGLPTEAIGFRDEKGKLRCICAYYPTAGIIMDLRINKHISSLAHRRSATPMEHDVGLRVNPTLTGRLNWNARNFRGEGL